MSSSFLGLPKAPKSDRTTSSRSSLGPLLRVKGGAAITDDIWNMEALAHWLYANTAGDAHRYTSQGDQDGCCDIRDAYPGAVFLCQLWDLPTRMLRHTYRHCRTNYFIAWPHVQHCPLGNTQSSFGLVLQFRSNIQISSASTGL